LQLLAAPRPQHRKRSGQKSEAADRKTRIDFGLVFRNGIKGHAMGCRANAKHNSQYPESVFQIAFSHVQILSGDHYSASKEAFRLIDAINMPSRQIKQSGFNNKGSIVPSPAETVPKNRLGIFSKFKVRAWNT
jgi:hypothetical protein